MVFSYRFYTSFAEQFGGGQPAEVRLEVEEAAVADMERVGLKFVKGSNVTEPVYLMNESEEYLAVYPLVSSLSVSIAPLSQPLAEVNPSRRVIQLDRKIVRARFLANKLDSDDALSNPAIPVTGPK
jgi:hypothetical protein